MTAQLYKKFIALAFSYCPSGSCTSDTNGEDHYTAFLLFSYPNGTDWEFNINNYLFENNKKNSDNIIVDMKQKVKIENNLFGYTYYGYLIKENTCNNIILLSYQTNITINFTDIVEDEIIILKLENRTIYNKTNCIIKYAYVYTDPKYEDYQKYTNYYDNTYGSFNENSYNAAKDKYEGKTIYLSIKIEEDLFTECEKNCELCLERENNCITCKNNYTIISNGSVPKKICLEETDIPTEKITETTVSETEKQTEKLTDK